MKGWDEWINVNVGNYKKQKTIIGWYDDSTLYGQYTKSEAEAKFNIKIVGD